MQTSLGWVEDAAISFKRAVELGPREPRVFYLYGYSLFEMHREAEARAALDRAVELAPDSVLYRLFRATAEISWSGDTVRANSILAGLPAGRDPDGRVTSARCTTAVLERNFPEALRTLQAYPPDELPMIGSAGIGAPEPKAFSEGTVRLFAGDRAGAYECFESIRWKYELEVEDQPESVWARGGLAELYAMMGWKEPALAEIARTTELETAAGTGAERRFNWAVVYAWLGEPDLAWPHIQRLITPPSMLWVNDLRLDPAWDPLRNDPRFQKLLATGKL